ncbi:DUF6894 family protein [Microvirga rosea]|uniref:DUF6894 family protein n=1 Tax=Microvirga rosea TaxID=2715425 RepID=UPI001D09CC05|nr:hypothetical protein [Microvirga rosea]MCB8821893.1 hypothetical protein [Microvirga rosea]
MRCYFNLSNGDSYLADHDGVEVSSLLEAHGEALDAIRETFLHQDAADVDLQGWALDVVDPSGRVLLSMSIGDVVDASDLGGYDSLYDIIQ